MAVSAVFVVLVLIGDTIAIGIASIVEQYSKTASLLIFLCLFVTVFCVAWALALRITERHLVAKDYARRETKVNAAVPTVPMGG